MAADSSEKTLAELVTDLTREAGVLVRDEVLLAKSELGDKVDQAAGGATSLVVGGMVAFAGLIILLQAVALIVTDLLGTTQSWVGPLIVGIVIPIVGLIIIWQGRRRLGRDRLTPRRLLHSLRRDREILRG